MHIDANQVAGHAGVDGGRAARFDGGDILVAARYRLRRHYFCLHRQGLWRATLRPGAGWLRGFAASGKKRRNQQSAKYKCAFTFHGWPQTLSLDEEFVAVVTQL